MMLCTKSKLAISSGWHFTTSEIYLAHGLCMLFLCLCCPMPVVKCKNSASFESKFRPPRGIKCGVAPWVPHEYRTTEPLSRHGATRPFSAVSLLSCSTHPQQTPHHQARLCFT